MLDLPVKRVGGGERLLLCVGCGIERPEEGLGPRESRYRARDRQDRRVRFPAAPESVIGLLRRFPKLLARGLG